MTGVAANVVTVERDMSGVLPAETPLTSRSAVDFPAGCHAVTTTRRSLAGTHARTNARGNEAVMIGGTGAFRALVHLFARFRQSWRRGVPRKQADEQAREPVRRSAARV